MSPDRGSLSNGLESTARRLDIKRLKQWATDTLPSSYYLREVIKMEPNELSIEDYLTKIPLWLKLLELDTKNGLGKRAHTKGLKGKRRENGAIYQN